MKKIIAVTMTLLLLLSITLTGCSSSTDKATSTPADTSTSTVQDTSASADTSSTTQDAAKTNELSKKYNAAVVLFNEVNDACKGNGTYDSVADVKLVLDKYNATLAAIAGEIQGGNMKDEDIDTYFTVIDTAIMSGLNDLKKQYVDGAGK